MKHAPKHRQLPKMTRQQKKFLRQRSLAGKLPTTMLRPLRDTKRGNLILKKKR